MPREAPVTNATRFSRSLMSDSRRAMYPKARIDALTDGLFGVAMTILVLDVRLPDTVQADQTNLVNALGALWPKLLPYAVSFYVLGSTWLANTKLRSTAESVGKRYVASWLLYLFIA